MATDKELSIHLKYDNKTCILISKRSEFMQRVSAKCGIREEEIDVYEIYKNQLTKIDVGSLKDFIHVEVQKKRTQNQIMNGHSDEPDDTTPHSTFVGICSKLKENQLLSLRENKLLFNHLQSLPLYLKRRLDSGNVGPIEMKNRKIQANPIDQKVVYTQTDKLIELSKPSTSTAQQNNVLQVIKRYARKEKRDPAVVEDLMSKTFLDRRNFILITKPMVQLVKERYPLLFNMQQVRNELDRILNVGNSDEFLNNISKYADIILHMVPEDDPLLNTIQERVRGCPTVAKKKYALEVGSILMLSNLVAESRCFLKLRDSTPTADPGDLPYIEGSVKFNEIFHDTAQATYRVYTEKMLLCEASDFKEAILALMASFFIFNISYPDRSFNTLVLMEKLYMEASDTVEADIEENVKQHIKTIQLKFKVRQK